MTRPRVGWENALEMRRVPEVGTEEEKRGVLSSRAGRSQARVVLRGHRARYLREKALSPGRGGGGEEEARLVFAWYSRDDTTEHELRPECRRRGRHLTLDCPLWRGLDTSVTILLSAPGQ